MSNTETSGSPGWSASFFMQTTEEVARAVAAAAASATTVHSSRPSVIFSSKDDRSSQLRKLQRQVARVLKGFSSPPEVKKRTYNPEILTSLKRQWVQSLDQRSVKEPSRLFESMVVVGLHPNSDIQALQQQIFATKSESSGKLIGSLSSQNLARVKPNIEPQVLFVYPPEKQLPLKYKDLLSFCFPGGTEVHAVERTPSMSELNEILLGQEHLKQSDLSFVFRLQVADDSTLYGCCVLVEEVVQQPSGLISMMSDKQTFSTSLSRHILTTPRCYCILSRLPFFELHFAVLNSIFTEERLERLTKGMGMLDLDLMEGHNNEEELQEKSEDFFTKHDSTEDVLNGSMETSEISTEGSTPRKVAEDASQMEHQMLERDFDLLSEGIHNCVISPINSETEMLTPKGETRISDAQEISVDELAINKQTIERRLPEAVLPLLRFCPYESSESSISFQGSPSEERNFRSDGDEAEMEEASSSGQEDSSDHNDILEWAKANDYGSLQIICEYYRLRCPARGTPLRFQPLEHLPSVEFHRPGETILHSASSTIDIRSCNRSLELAEAHNALLDEEEATALSVWTVACICGSFRLENVLTIFAGALLEKQIVVVCSNLGNLSALVLSIIPLIRPYHWQSFLMPVLPNDMLDFLDAPVPYVVGVKNKTTEVQSKLSNIILVDANKNQVRSPTLPQLPQHKELFSSLSPYHAKLVGESYLARKRPVYECTDAQIEAAKGFLAVLRSYLDSLCSNLRSHTITNVQSNDDKVSLLLKESFIDSFPSRDRSFMKPFVDTQLFSVHTDIVLSFFQKE
ncbi:hypothetical protein NE237_029572 [Protea cynaroides]|uniref:UDENN domain-containing protein n=1 Tax=Protea cynaroides TaxID=273540 RepID=A0A9Q0GSI9_9MAGN|nr:hypothetical protein NE237_029572 [Protea cynaroides]